MGVDARMLLKLPAPHHVAPADLRPLAYRLSSTIGYDHFFIDDEQHALSFAGEDDWDHGVPGNPGEQLLQVNLMGRYYGPGYERGNWPVLRAIVELLKRMFPAGSVWYGGDSGDPLEELTPARLAALDDHFFQSGRSGYTRHPARGRGGAPTCRRCDVEVIHTGGGGAQTFWVCDGCGAYFITENGRAYEFDKWSEIFAAADLVRSGAADIGRVNHADRRGGSA